MKKREYNMKILYLTTWDFSNEESDGVCKKIYSQIESFKEQGNYVDFIYIKDNHIIYNKEDFTENIGRVGNMKKTIAYMKMYEYLKAEKYDWVYNRYGIMDAFYYRVLKRLRNNGAKIIVEIPTYPYKGEKNKGILYDLMFKWDDWYLHKLKNVVDRIVTYSLDKNIFEIPTIHIINGIDVKKVPLAVREKDDKKTINLLIVALMQSYHGYERLLYGLKEYYQQGGQRNIVCHFVGDGPEKTNYENIVFEYGLEQRVIFYGKKGGIELDEIYNKIDIGICSLGCYKKKIFLSSELKSREYLARGVPFVVGVTLDIKEVLDKEMFLEVPNDSSVLNIEEIIEFYDLLQNRNREQFSKELRRFALNNLSIQATMKSVLDYINTEEE